jgi:hypothetical protein
MKLKLTLVVLAAALLCGFGWHKKEKKPAERRMGQESLPAGYALLFKLLGDEKDVSKLLIIKKDKRALHDLIKEISSATGEEHKRLEKIGKTAGINLEDEQLPPIETAARESISKEKAKQLLSAKGEDFQFRLLLTQNEALTYGRHLALALLHGETEPDRRAFLESVAKTLDDLQPRVFEILMHPVNRAQ